MKGSRKIAIVFCVAFSFFWAWFDMSSFIGMLCIYHVFALAGAIVYFADNRKAADKSIFDYCAIFSIWYPLYLIASYLGKIADKHLSD